MGRLRYHCDGKFNLSKSSISAVSSNSLNLLHLIVERFPSVEIRVDRRSGVDGTDTKGVGVERANVHIVLE